MKRRRWIIRLSILVGILVVLLILFSVLFFNPFEGDLENLDAMVPQEFGGRRVSFVVRAQSLESLQGDAFVSARLRSSPLWASMKQERNLDELLFDQIEDAEQQIRMALGGLVDFGVWEDLFGREILVAGALDPDDIGASPYLFLTRISWKAKFLDLLGYETVRERVNQPGRFQIRSKRFWYEIVIEDPAMKRDPGAELVYYVARVRDVLAFSNDQDLMKLAVVLGEAEGIREDSIRRHGGYARSLPYDTAGSRPAAWFDVLELNNAHGLAASLEPDPGEPRGLDHLLFELVPPRVQYDASVALDLVHEDRADVTVLLGEISKEGLPRHLESYYGGEWFDRRTVFEELGRYAPADRTIALAALAIDPPDFFRVLYAYLTPSQQELLAEELQKSGQSPEDLADDLGRYLERPVGLVLSRMNEKVDALPLDSLEEGDGVKPREALVLTMRFKDESRIPIFLEYVAEVAPRLGHEAPRTPVTPDGLPEVQYVPLTNQYPEEDDPLLAPAVAVVGDRFFFSTNGDELLRILKGASGNGTLAGDVEIDDLLDEGEAEAGMLVLARGEGLRSWLLDQRWERAYRAAEAIVTDPRVTNRKLAEFAQEASRGRDMDQKVREERDRLFAEWKNRTEREEFDKGLASWKRAVSNLEPLRMLLFTLRPDVGETEGSLVLQCEPGR